MEAQPNVIDSTWKKLSLVFHGVCWIATTSVVSYWIYIFSLNEDLCVVDYKKYYQEKTDHYPVLSLCFENPFSSKSQNLSHSITPAEHNNINTAAVSTNWLIIVEPLFRNHRCFPLVNFFQK